MDKLNLNKPIDLLKKQFNQLAMSNLDKGNELTSKQILSYVQSIYGQLQILQQIIQLRDEEKEDDKNESYSYSESDNIIDDIAINLQFSLNNVFGLYDNFNLSSINSTIKFIEEVLQDLNTLKQRNLHRFIKIKKIR